MCLIKTAKRIVDRKTPGTAKSSIYDSSRLKVCQSVPNARLNVIAGMKTSRIVLGVISSQDKAD